MLKWFTELLASVSSLFIMGVNKPSIAPPLNTAVIAYQETYYAPVVADPENFPRAKTIESANKEIAAVPSVPAPKPVVPPTPPAPPVAPAPAPVPTPPAAIPDSYLATPEPITSWLSMNLTFMGSSNDAENPRVLPELVFDREYWRMEVFAYWAPDVVPPKPDIENDYFKLEVYEKGTNKLIYTVVSGKDESLHKFQSFRKPGTYYFKVYTKNPSEWEVSFVVSPKLAQQ